MNVTHRHDAESIAAYRTEGWWEDRILWDDVANWAARFPTKLAVADDKGEYCYRELLSTATSVASGLDRVGVRYGDVVAIQMPPIKEFVPVFLAVERLGAVVCPLIPSLTGADLEQMLKLAGVRVLVTVDRHRNRRIAETAIEALDAVSDDGAVVVVGQEIPSAAVALDAVISRGTQFTPVPKPRGDDLAELAFTSGTSGEPKGVMHTHDTSLSGIKSTISRQEVGSSDVVHVALPVGHNFGYFYGVRLALAAGASLVLQRYWDPHTMLHNVATRDVTVSSGTPTHLRDLLGIEGSWHGRLASLRLFTCAGAELAPELAERAIDILPGRLSRAFGMTEVGHVTATGPDTPREKLLVSEGRPQPGVELRVLGDNDQELATGVPGQLAFRGPFIFAGYVQGEDATKDVMTDDGFFRTGDLGYVDSDGYLVMTGRTKEILIRGGENISLPQLEGALHRHPLVADVGVTAVPDERLGERPVACIKLAADQKISLEDLQTHLHGQGLSKVYWPEACVFVDSIPRNETGKILRDQLRTLVDACTLIARSD